MSENGLPVYDLRLRMNGETREVWDELRKKWLVLTPEEYVRQCLIRYFLEEKSVPPGLVSIERGLKYNTLQKRYDVVIYDREGRPLVATECKRPNVELTQDTMMQLATYNTKIGAPFLCLTNGKHLLFFAKGADGTFRVRESIPPFTELLEEAAS